MGDATLDDARQAFERHAWRVAHEAFAAADADVPLEPDDLERLAEAAWWIGHLSEVIGATERAYTGYLAGGRKADAARAALRLAAEYGHRHEPAVAAGWQRRAERLLATEPESATHALLSRSHFNSALESADYEAALKHARATYEIAERQGNSDLMAMALHDQGQVLVARGDVAEGMGLIDEATVAAVAGELGPFATAVVYCNTINACRGLADYARANEWTEAAKRWCERQSIAGFPGMCRVGRAEIIRLRGDWTEAAEQASLAAAELRDFYLDYAGEGFYQLGEIRLRMGEFAAAEDYFRQAAEMGRDPQPGLALLRLAEGRPEIAGTMLRTALAESPGNRLAQAKLEAALVEVEVALGHVTEARALAIQLRATSDAYGTPALLAAAAQAEGTVQLAAGDHDGAATTARQAVRLWRELDFPYELGRARALLGKAVQARGDAESASSEFAAALALFERLGAPRDAADMRALLGRPATELNLIERSTATFMFTDIVGSTPLIGVIGDEAWETLLRWHDRALREIFLANRGEVAKQTGDGFLVAYAAADDAVTAAQAVQRALADHRREHGFAPQVRIGLHTAQAVRHERDFSGAGIHVAARVAALADGGEILVTRDVLEAATQPLDVVDRRERSLKGISQAVEVARIEWRRA